MKAGFVAIIGLPNVGKSTLMNHLLGQKIAIASPRPQTTRNRILGVKNIEGAQIAFIDTPGMHRPGGRSRSSLNKFMVDEVMQAVADVDALLWIVESPDGQAAKQITRAGYRLPKDVETLLDTVKQAGKPTVLGLNKIDLLHNKQALLPVLESWSKAYEFKAIVPISATTGAGASRLIEELVTLLPEGERLFPEEMITDRAERWLAAEMVREQVFILTRQEIPYSVAVTVDTFEERPEKGEHAANVMIEATIHIEKDNQKRIIVGEGGRMVREIGSRARLEIGKLLDCEVHLKLFVRVDEEWSQSEAGLHKMGYE